MIWEHSRSARVLVFRMLFRLAPGLAPGMPGTLKPEEAMNERLGQELLFIAGFYGSLWAD